MRDTSTDLICDFLRYAICSILLYRGFYNELDFVDVNQYGLRLLLPCHPELVQYLDGLMKHLYNWVGRTEISELQFTVLDAMRAPVEKYTFEFIVTADGRTPTDETYRTIKNSLHALLALVIHRPELVGNHDFVIQVKEHAGSAIPQEWFASAERAVPHAEIHNLPTAFIFEAGIKSKVYCFSPLSELIGWNQ